MKKSILKHIVIIAALVGYFNANAQKSDYIVSKANDTIRVDKITLTDKEVKTITNGKKKKYSFEDVVSYYDLKDNKVFERVSNPDKQKVATTKIDRYDHKRLESSHIETYESGITYKFFERLTDGKVKLFVDSNKGMTGGSGIPGQSGYTPAAAYDDRVYYIAIYDSKLELVSDSGALKLKKNVYELLKIYLYGNNEIANRLDALFTSKPIAKEAAIITLINDYNT